MAVRILSSRILLQPLIAFVVSLALASYFAS